MNKPPKTASSSLEDEDSTSAGAAGQTNAAPQGLTAAPEKKLQNGNSSHLPDVNELPRFVRDVAAWRGLGYSLREISRNYGVTPQALSVMLVRQRQRWRSSPVLASGELAGLSPRAINCLGRLGISKRDDARRLAGLEKCLRSERNCGSKTIREILDWASKHVHS